MTVPDDAGPRGLALAVVDTPGRGDRVEPAVPLTTPELDAATEQDITRLAAIWLHWSSTTEQASEVAAGVVAAAVARGDPQVEPFSAAYALLRDWAFSRDVKGLVARVDATLARLRPTACERAIRLAEVVWAQLHLFLPQRREQALALLESHGDALTDSRPAAERFWTEDALCILHCISERYDDALVHGLHAENLADVADADVLRQYGLNNLACVFLCVGDVEAASTVLHKSMQALGRQGMRNLNVNYNLLLSLMLGRRFAEATSFLADLPWLCEPESFAIVPLLRSMVARVRLAGDRPDEAAALIGYRSPPGTMEQPLARINRAWIEGDILLALGRPQEARDLVQSCLAATEGQPLGLMPMNSTQLHRVLSEACEATGDLRASLDALKRSQAECFTWVGDSVRARLLALQHTSAGAGASTHAQRLQLLSQAVDQARQEATETASARQQRYLAQVMQEVRNPLNGVIGMTSLLMMSDLDKRQQQYANLARSSAQMLMALCDDLLDLTKIESGRFELLVQPADLAAMLTEVTQLLAPLAEAGGVEMRLNIDPALPTPLLCDRLRLQQVVMNLLGNAVKFTRRGHIELSATWLPGGADDAPGELRVAVRDTGRGVTPEERARLFKDFSQANAGIAHSHGGTGLGLALCRRLMEQMGGQIDMDSVPGQGSTFWFQLPLTQPHAG